MLPTNTTLQPIQQTSTIIQIAPILGNILRFTGRCTFPDHAKAPFEQIATIKSTYQIHRVCLAFFQQCCRNKLLEVKLEPANLTTFYEVLQHRRLFREGAPAISWKGFNSMPSLVLYELHNSLRTMSFSYSLYLQNSVIQNLAIHCREVNTVNLKSCEELSDLAMLYLTQLPYITSIDISYCNALTPKSLVYLAQIPMLNTLICENCNIVTDQGLEALRSSSSITSLDVSDCSYLTNEGVIFLQALPLKILILNEDKIFADDIAITHLSKCTSLTSLSLAYTNITPRSIACLAAATDSPRLRSLDLSYCKELIPDCLVHLSQMRSLTNLSLPNEFSQTNEVQELKKQLPDIELKFLQKL